MLISSSPCHCNYRFSDVFDVVTAPACVVTHATDCIH